MKRNIALIVALLAIVVVPAMAATIDLTVAGIGNDITASLQLTLGTEYSPGVWGITNVTGTYSNAANGISGAVTDPYPVTGGMQLSPDNLYNYDQLFYIAGPVFDATGGVFFDVAGGVGAGGSEINIAGIDGGFQIWETTAAAPSSYLPPSIWPGYSADVQVVPEPGGGAMLPLGALLIAGAWGWRRWKVRTATTIS